MAEDVSRAARAVREGLDALRLRASRWGAPRPRFWIDERTTKSCFECGVAFSLVTRKHHCRACGRVFCQKCSSHALPPRDDPEGPPERACDVCFASHADAAEPRRASTSSAKKRVSARSPRVPDAALSRVASERLAGSSPTSSVSSRPASASASRRARGPAGSADDSDSDSDEDASESDASDDDASDDADAVVSDANLSDGAADTRTRAHGERNRAFPLESYSRARLTRADENRGVTGHETEGEAETPAERPARPTSETRRYRAGKPKYAAHAAHAAALADETLWAPPPPGLEPGPTSSSDVFSSSDAPVNAALIGLAARFLRRELARAAEVFSSETENKTDAFVDTWTPFVSALALECARAVEPSRFAFSAQTDARTSATDPRRTRDDARRVRYDMDPLSYVSIRRVATGAPSSSSLARDAWSLKRNVADRRMATRRGVVSATSAETLARRHLRDLKKVPRDDDAATELLPGNTSEASPREPRDAPETKSNDASQDGVRVALLGGALEYQRATDKPRLASFETLLDQEHEHLRAAAARVLVSKPDVALVERTVARFARDLFLERGVSLAVGVGAEELSRLAFRFAPRGEERRSRVTLAADGGAVRGTCAGWSVESFEQTLFDETETETEENARTPLLVNSKSGCSSRHQPYMTFFGLPKGSGCVLTLRGAAPSALKAVESATRLSLRAAYHLDRVSLFVAAAVTSHVGASASKDRIDRFCAVLLQSAATTAAQNATVPLVSRAFCPTRVNSLFCDPPVGFRSNVRDTRHISSVDKSVPEIVPYGPEDLPLGAALLTATAWERGVTECPHARCGEHPAKHVRVFYVTNGKVTMRANTERRREHLFERSDDDADGAPWTYWSRCRSCGKESPGKESSPCGAAGRDPFPFATPARASASPVAVRKKTLELSLARFLELLGTDVPEDTFERDASRDGDCVHASPRHRAHYFASALGTVCFAFDDVSPLALVVSPTSPSPSSADAPDVQETASTASSARFDARCAAAAAALCSDAYGAAMAAFGCEDDASVASEHVVVAELGVTAYFARQFRAARSVWWNGARSRNDSDDSEAASDDDSVEAVFAKALSQCAYWDVGARGGKSRAFFARSLCGRFVVKQVSKVELECLLSVDFISAYFKRVGTKSEASESERDSLLAATLGAFTVAPARAFSSRKDDASPSMSAFDFVVLENAFFGARVGGGDKSSLRVYDLKGSLRGRYAVGLDDDERDLFSRSGNGAATERELCDDDSKNYDWEKTQDTMVLMDGNLAETCAIEPILLQRDSFLTLERLIKADVAFLAEQNVMDYSLLVGIEPDTDTPGRREVVVRVIDYLRRYTWDKQIESAVKSGVPSAEGAPTVLSPEKYARRFRRVLLRRYFLAVPDDGA